MAITVTNTALDLLSTDLLRLSRGNARPPVEPVDLVEADTGGKSTARREQQSQSQYQGQTLTSLVRPQASLSPSEELAVFASSSLETGTVAQLPPPPVDNPPELVKATLANLAAFRASQEEKASQEVQVTEEVTVEAPANPGQQAFAAYLYARNNDIVFTNTPLAQIAA